MLKLLLGMYVLAIASCTKNPENPGNDNDSDLKGLDKTTYTYFDEALTNPERGWYVYNNFNFPYGGGKSTSPMTTSSVESRVSSGVTIIHTIYHMYDFVDKPLTQAFLDTFEANMDAIREGGAKCLLRFAYSSSYDSANNKPKDNSDAPFDVFSGQIAQLKPLIQKHSDVLYVMEAGFIGAWGEWYYTSNYVYQPKTVADYVPRRQLLEKLLDAVPKDRMVCVRYPAAKVNMYDLTYADSLTLANAFNQSDFSRIAMHNDCFVASANDTGTFFSTEQRDLWKNDSRYLIMGGETCGVSKFSVCDNTITQMENYHWSYLNSNYHTAVINGWRTEGCYDEINKRLGYRLSLTEAYFTPEPAADKPLQVVLFIKNDGFAAPMNPRDCEIVFKEKAGSGDPVRIKTSVDPRYWFAAQTHKVKLSLDISELTAGKTYEVFLNLPDPKPALNTRPAYSIRLANQNVWDGETGYNKLREITLE